MAIAEQDSDTETISVVDTPQQIGTTITDDGSYQLIVDLDNMVDGDAVEIWIEAQVLAAGGYVQVFPKATYTNDQGSRAAYFPEIKNINGIKFWINQSTGTARSFDYMIYKYA